MTIEGFAGRLVNMRTSFPNQVICAFHYPDDLEVFVPISPELLSSPPEIIGPALMKMVQSYAAGAREKKEDR